jgi:hypothetical protein
MCDPIFNASFIKPTLFIGVKSYRMLLKNPCKERGYCENEIYLSFELSGKFLNAALFDEIKETVSYDLLCQMLKDKMTMLWCHQVNRADVLKTHVLQFSPLIEGGFIKLSGKRHDVFFNDECLL